MIMVQKTWGVMLVFMVGCVVPRVSHKEEWEEDLKKEILMLEAKIQERDRNILAMESDLLIEQKKAARVRREPEKMPSVRQIQRALKRGGFDPGPIDGIIGEKTRKALREFQQRKGLTVTGKVDKKTWDELKEY